MDDNMWQMFGTTWLTHTDKYDVEVWKTESIFYWTISRHNGEYVFAGKASNLEIAQREALLAAR